MAVGHIIFNDQLPHGRRLRSFLNLLDQVQSDGNELLLLMAQMKDGGNVGQYLADKFGFGLLPGSNPGTAGDVSMAQAGVGEFESVVGKLNTTGNTVTTGGADYSNRTDHVKDAILQVIAKFG